MTKGDLQECIDEATQILDVPDADGETLATAIGDAMAALEGDTDDDEDWDDEDHCDDDSDDEDVISEESIAIWQKYSCDIAVILQ